MNKISALIAAACLAAPVPAVAQEIQPYHATLITPAPRAGVDVASKQSAMPRGLVGLWILKVPGVAYTTNVDYGAYTEETLHVSPGAAAGYLRITRKRTYVWYGSDGKAVSHGRLMQIVPRLDARAGTTYWRVLEGRDAHYVCLNADGTISVYDTGTDMVSMEGKHG
jgi:hypothetical protein